jgi:hypothetical protein
VPTTYKVLGQVVSTANVDTNVYTVPSSTTAIISSIVVVNRGTDGTTFRLSVRPNGATVESKHYVAYDVPISRNDSTVLSFGITMDAADVITINGANNNLSVSVFGTEITA